MHARDQHLSRAPPNRRQRGAPRLGGPAWVRLRAAEQGRVQDDDRQLLEFLESVGVTPILVATKIDKLPANKRKPAVAKLQREVSQRLIPYSSVIGDGRDALWNRILSVSSINRLDAPAEP